MNEQINQSDVFVIFRNTEINFDDYKITPLDTEQLLIFKQDNDLDLAMMTAKPIIDKSDAEVKKSFDDLLNDKNNCLLGIIDKDNKIIGRISLYNYNKRNRSAEVGYVLSENYQGRGIMTTALHIILAKLFATTYFNKILNCNCKLDFVIKM